MDILLSLVTRDNDFQREQASSAERAAQRLACSLLPFTGCDGLPGTGAAWVDQGMLAATVVVPPNTGAALEMMTRALRDSKQPPANSLTEPRSYPPLESIYPTKGRVTFRAAELHNTGIAQSYRRPDFVTGD